MMYEERLKRYFEQEGAKGDLSPQQWERLLLRVKAQKQRRWLRNLVKSRAIRRPALLMAATVAIAVMAGAASLWVTAPWEGSSLHRPSPLPGPIPMPSPRIIETVWEPNKRLVSPGEPIATTLTLKNVWNKRIEVTDFPKTVTLVPLDTDAKEPIPVALKGIGDFTVSLEPGEEIIAVANITSHISAGLQPGRYVLRAQVRFLDTPSSPENGEIGLGFGGTTIVVIPPEGAMDTTVIVGQVREAQRAKIMLEKIHFTPEKTTIAALAAPLLEGSAVPERSHEPAPTASPGGNVANLTARYRIDGGPWRQLRGHGYRMTAEGVHHEWRFGPVSANANTLVLAIMFETSPENGVTSLWEWTVALQESE